MFRHTAALGRLAHRAAAASTSNPAVAAAAYTQAAAASVAVARPAHIAHSPSLLASSHSAILFARSITDSAAAAPAGTKGGDRHKGMRAKRQDEEGEGEVVDVEAASVDVHDVAAAAAAKKAAREAKKAKEVESKQSLKAEERAARRAKKEAQKEASIRADQKFKASVIEKEVPLMDLAGIKPGQNKYGNVLEVMRDENFPKDVIQDLEQIGDYATASTREILSGRITNLIDKFGRKPYDTGSPEVQIAVLTERLKGYDRHMVEHKSDINSRRGFLAIWHRRRKLLKYLRRTKYETYAFMMKELQLREADIDSVGLDRTSGTQAARIKRD